MLDPMLPAKVCAKCGRRKLLSEFHRNAGTLDGFQRQCRRCHRISKKRSTKAWQARHIYRQELLPDGTKKRWWEPRQTVSDMTVRPKLTWAETQAAKAADKEKSNAAPARSAQPEPVLAPARSVQPDQLDQPEPAEHDQPATGRVDAGADILVPVRGGDADLSVQGVPPLEAEPGELDQIEREDQVGVSGEPAPTALPANWPPTLSP